jgi:hypothetical protein
MVPLHKGGTALSWISRTPTAVWCAPWDLNPEPAD